MLIKYFDLGMQLFCVIALLSECFCLVYHFMGVGGGGRGQFVDTYSACTSFGSYTNMPWLQSDVCLHFLMSGFLSVSVVRVTFPEVDTVSYTHLTLPTGR